MTREQFENIAKLAVMEMANYDRGCDNCKHHVTRNGETGCECWECEYEKGGKQE